MYTCHMCMLFFNDGDLIQQYKLYIYKVRINKSPQVTISLSQYKNLITPAVFTNVCSLISSTLKNEFIFYCSYSITYLLLM